MEALILFVKTFGIEITGAIIGGGLIVFLMIYIISAITGRNFGLEIGSFKLNTRRNANGNDSRIEKIKVLLNFDNDKDNENSILDTLVNAIKNKTREKDIVEFQQTVINQMSCAEDFNIQIKALMTSSYADLMRQKDSTIDVRQHRDYKFYQVLVSSVLDELKRNTLKESIKSIDIISLSPQEFEQFVDQKVNVMITLMIEYLDLMYQNTNLVSRDEVHKENELLSVKIKESYRNLYYKIKNIMIEDNKYIEEINQSMNDDVANMKVQLGKNCVVNQIGALVKEPQEKKG